jgi:hypothetical protein
MKITITYPESWADIRLSKYLEFYRQLKPYEQTETYSKKLVELGAYHFCNVNPDVLYKLPKATLDKIEETIIKFTNTNQAPLVKTFTVDNTEYGFLPNIEEMSYGEYLDLTEYFKKMWDYMPIIMSILYRPVVKQLGKSYTIETYNGTSEERIEFFKHILTMDVVFGAISFFLDLQKDLLIGTQIYLKDLLNKVTQNGSHLQTVLEQNGVDTIQLQFLQEMISSNLTVLQHSPSINA